MGVMEKLNLPWYLGFRLRGVEVFEFWAVLIYVLRLWAWNL